MKRIVVFISLTTLFLLSACSTTFEDFDYDKLEEYNVTINKISYEESKKIIQNSTGTRELILFSDPACENCQIYFPIIVSELEEFDFVELNYIDTSQMTLEEASDSSEYFNESRVPATYIAANGYIQDKIIGAAPGELVREFLIRHYH
ncbi:hypothetical protein RI065_10530 [Mycoplasmatota bacterium zrk1]